MSDAAQPLPTPAFPIARVVRLASLWVAMVLIVALIALSILSATGYLWVVSPGHWGKDWGRARTWTVEDSRSVFNSAPMAVLWAALAASLLAGPIFLRRLRAIGPLAMHVGPALVLIGAVWGSQPMHNFRMKHLGETRVWRGGMELHQGEPTDIIYPVPDISEHMEDGESLPAVALPFSLTLDKFWMDLYKPAPEKWRIWTPVLFDNGKQGHYAIADWHIGRPYWIFPEHPLVVRAYYPHARIAPQLQIFLKSEMPTSRPEAMPTTMPAARIGSPGRPIILPAEPGATVTAGPMGAEVKVVRAFGNYELAGREEFDLPGPAIHPALDVEVAYPDSDEPIRVLVPGDSLQQSGDFIFYYAMNAVADAHSPFPAAEVQIGDSRPFWLVPPDDPRDAACITWPFREAMTIALVRYNPRDPDEVKSYNAKVTIRQGDQQFGPAVVRVNHPVHFGGYHIYQVDFEKHRNDVTILRLVADGGLGWVYAGFFLTLVGVFWKCWGVPIGRWAARRWSHG